MKRQKTLTGRENRRIGLIAVLIMLLFRIPLAGIIGDKGNAYLAVSWEIYQIFFLIFVFAYTKLMVSFVETRMAKKKYQNSVRAAKGIFLSAFFSSVLGALLLFFTSGWIGNKYFNMPLIEISLKLFAPLLFANALLNLYRAFFEGSGTIVPTDISRLVEGVVIVTAALIGVFYTRQYGSKVGALLHNEDFVYGFTAAGVVAGYLCGSIFALLFIIFVYITYKTAFTRQLKKDVTSEKEKKKDLYRAILVGIPIVLAEGVWIKIYRFTNLSLFLRHVPPEESSFDPVLTVGSFYGKASVIMITAVVIILLITQKRNGDEFRSGKQLLTDNLRGILGTSLPIGTSLLVLAEPLMKTLFGTAGQTVVNMMRISAVTVILLPAGVFLVRISNLFQLKRQLIIVQIIAFLIQTAAMAVIVQTNLFTKLSLNRLSMALAELIFWIVVVIGILLSLKKAFRMRLSVNRILLAPVVQTSVMLLVEILIVGLLGAKASSWLICLLAILAGGVFHQITGKLSFLDSE